MNNLQVRQGRLGRLLFLVLLGSITFFTGSQANGQESQPRTMIKLDRKVGFSLGTRIQGTFKISADGPAELSKVEFLIDGQLLAEDSSPPFEIMLQTSDYPAGKHTLSAVGFLENGQALKSELLRRDFVSGNWAFVVLAIIVVIVIVLRILPAIGSSKEFSNRQEGQVYGFLGGAICRSCQRPFRLHLWSPRLLVGKLQRCPHCGSWQLARRASSKSMMEAERAATETEGESRGKEKYSDDDHLLQLLEDSRFEDL